MKPTTLYHATNANKNTVIDYAELRHAVNGLGFYLTDDINVAKTYGINIITYDFSEHTELLAKMESNKINNGDLNTEHMEYVVIDKETLDTIIFEGLGE